MQREGECHTSWTEHHPQPSDLLAGKKLKFGLERVLITQMKALTYLITIKWTLFLQYNYIIDRIHTESM